MSRQLPVWALPPMALVIVLAIVGFPLRWLWEKIWEDSTP